MVAPPFGFSVGDFIAGGQLLVKVISAFKEAGGASSKYASEVSFLNSLKSTLDHLEQYLGNTSHSNHLFPDISKLLQEIREPWEDFKGFLDKYEPSLGVSSSRSKLGKAPRTIQYTLKDISGKVEKLRRQTQEPLQAVNSLLSLHVINSLERLPGQLLLPAQCAQLVEAIRLADIPTELDKQIQVLKLTADEHSVKQDQQLQIVSTLRSQLDDKLEGLLSALNDVKDDNFTASASRDRYDEQLDATRDVYKRVDQLSAVLEIKAEELESAMKDQRQLILALKSFLEDKTSSLDDASKSGGGKSTNEGEDQQRAASWPSATLSTAYFAALLLSSVLSSVVSTFVVNRRNERYPHLNQARGPVFLPVDYSLPGLRTTNTGRTEPSLAQAVSNTDITTSTIENPVAIQDESSSAADAMVSAWLFDWSTAQSTMQQPIEQQFKTQQVEIEIDDPGWSRKLSKLSDPIPEDAAGSDGGGFIDGPDLMLPLPETEGFDWGIAGGFGGGGDGGGGWGLGDSFGGGGGGDWGDDSDGGGSD